MSQKCMLSLVTGQLLAIVLCYHIVNDLAYINISKIKSTKANTNRFDPQKYLPFEEDLAGCSIPVVANRSKVKDFAQKHNADNKTCTPALFQEYFKERRHFFIEGVWYVPNDETSENVTFFPKFCNFDQTSIEHFTNCLQKKNFGKIVIHGDSNGLRYYRGIMNLVGNEFSCKPMREKENGQKRKDRDPYFQIPGGPIVQRFKGCSNCDSVTNVCQLKNSSSSFHLIIEYFN